MAATGVLALFTAMLQPTLSPGLSAWQLVQVWVSVACVNLALVLGEIGYHYLFSYGQSERRMTRHVLTQFAPSLGAGAVLTISFITSSPHQVDLLPGLWALVFGLGIFAARPYLVHGMGWVALFYLVAGGVLISMAGHDVPVNSWAMGGTFGFGQLFMALVLYWRLERKENVWNR